MPLVWLDGGGAAAAEEEEWKWLPHFYTPLKPWNSPTSRLEWKNNSLHFHVLLSCPCMLHQICYSDSPHHHKFHLEIKPFGAFRNEEDRACIFKQANGWKVHCCPCLICPSLPPSLPTSHSLFPVRPLSDWSERKERLKETGAIAEGSHSCRSVCEKVFTRHIIEQEIFNERDVAS